MTSAQLLDALESLRVEVEKRDGKLSITFHRSGQGALVVAKASPKKASLKVPEGLEALRQLWNCVKHESWPEWQESGANRIAAWAALTPRALVDVPGSWSNILGKAAQIPGLCGKVPGRDGRTFTLNPDALLRQGFAVKVLEGYYDNWRPNGDGPKGKEATLEKMKGGKR